MKLILSGWGSNKNSDYGVRNRSVKQIPAAYSLVVICLSVTNL